jgi:hypothetical protein
MDQYRAVSKVLRDLIQFGLIKEDDRGQARLHLDRLYTAGYDEGRKEIHVNHTKKVIRCDKNGEELETYNTVIDAARKIKCGASGIYSAISRKTMTKNGYRWKYKEEEA